MDLIGLKVVRLNYYLNFSHRIVPTFIIYLVHHLSDDTVCNCGKW
jgi:hypothetical protein